MRLRRLAELARLGRAALQLELLRGGLASGLFAALAEPRTEEELCEHLALAPDLCAAWLRAAHASGFVERRAGRYQRGAFAAWLLDEDAARAWLDEIALSHAPALARLPASLKGEPRPRQSAGDLLVRVRSRRLNEGRALAALGRVPGATRARRILEIGCGEGSFLTTLLARYRDALGLGVEQDPTLAERAREQLRAAQVERRCRIWSGDVLGEELPAGDWELVILNRVLPHWTEEERDLLFARVASRMSARGVLVIQTPVLREDFFARASGAAAGAALLDLALRAHADLGGLPDLTDLHVRLRSAGFARVGAVPVLPGGVLRLVWATRGQVD